MKNLFLLLTILGCSLCADAQNVQLINEKVIPADITFDGYVVKRIRINPREQVSYSLDSWQDELASKPIDSATMIADSFFVETSFSKERKITYALVSIPAFRRDGVEIKRLSHYTLKVTRRPDTVPVLHRPTEVTESVLSTGNWYKVAVDKRGVFKIDYTLLETMGLAPGSINPANIRIYGNGGTVLPEVVTDDVPDDLVENAIFVNSGSSSFGINDYVLFYANGPVAWRLKEDGSGFEHTQNYYEDKSYYFLTVDKGPGKRIEAVEGGGTADLTLTSFDGYSVLDVDSFNPGTQGKVWWSNRMPSSSVSAQTHNLNVVLGQSDGPVTMEVAAGGAMEASGNTLKFTSPDMDPLTLNIGKLAEYGFISPVSGIINFVPSTVSVNITMKLTAVSTGNAYLDYLRFNGKRKLNFSGENQLSFRDIDARLLSGTENVAYKIQGASSSIVVWEVTDPLNPTRVNGTLIGSEYGIVRPGGILREFIAFSNIFSTPSFVGKVDPQNLHGMEQIDLLIVTTQEFVGAAEDLADFHITRDGMRVAVVTTDKIYNEFSSGGQDIVGIRNFIKMFYDRASGESDMIKHLLLLGAASYDYKDRIPANTNFVPVYQTLASYSGTTSYSTDDFYSLMDLGERLESTSLLDISVGRIPATSAEQAQLVVNKIKSYKQNTSFGSWKNNIMFMTDNYDIGWGTSHSGDAEKNSTVLAQKVSNYNHIKLYGDVYPMENTPSGRRMIAQNKAMNDQIFMGTFLVNYSGHGSPTRLAAEDLLTFGDINAWTNANKLPVLVTATCDFGRFDDPQLVSGGVLAFMKSNGGCIASVTTTQLVYASANLQFNMNYTAAQFGKTDGGQWRSLGEAVRDGKNNYFGAGQNNVKYTLLGDPALTLALPMYNVVTDSLMTTTSGDVTATDTIKALGNYQLKGSVRDNDGAVMESFNGKVYMTIFDKEQTTPLEGLPDLTSYKTQNSIVYRGQATVKEGKFSIVFVVPKDINYDLGKGKISYYADDGNVDAAGADTAFFVGGFSTSAGLDNEGPLVQPYIDSDKFRDGGVTGPDPLLFVKLSDDNGINVTGSSVGHDLIALLDGDWANPFVLNNYYQTEPDDFTKGTVSFPMAGIAPGKHRLTLRAWDTYNNSGEGEVNFEVVPKDQGAISEVYNYPNPFGDYTTFVIQHNLSKEDLAITIQIFNTAGALITTVEKQLTPEGNRTEIRWESSSSNGTSLATGLYFYRVQIKSAKGVAATSYQKMVLTR